MYSLSDKSKLTDFRCVVVCVDVDVIGGVTVVLISFVFDSLSNTSISVPASSVTSTLCCWGFCVLYGDGGRGGGFFDVNVSAPDDRLSFDDLIVSY